MLLSNATDHANSAASDSATALKKGPWSAAEDAVLVEYVNKNGEGNWNAVQRNTGLHRCGKSCRLRWANHLRPNLKKGAFSIEEERLIIHLHSKLGNKWARISSHLSGRTDNEIKNYWNTRVKRRLRQGLPLYPNNQTPSISTQTPKMTPFQSSPYPISFTQNPQITTNQNTLSLFNPISLPSSFLPLHHPPPSLPSHLIRHCSNTFLGRTFLSPTQMGQYHTGSNGFGTGFGFDSGQVPPTRFGVEGFSFDNLSNFELPSNQIVANNHDVVDDMKDNTNACRAKSGLLDDLLQEAAQIKAVNRGVKRERGDCELDWDGLASQNSISGTKKEQDQSQELNLGNDDLSSILDLIPSLVQAPGWCNNGGGGGESPVDQSTTSVVSTENNYDGGLDNMPEPPVLTDLSPSDYDDDDGGDEWNPGSYAWDNLPKM